MSAKSDSGAAFASFLAAQRPLIDNYLKEHGPAAADGPQSSELTRYLYRPLARFTAEGGKRTRPALCLLGAAAVGGDPKAALPVADAIETFQSAALIHDDIADKSELRRGQPCVHVTEGTGVAINVGDLALVNVESQILRTGDYAPDVRLRLLEEVLLMEERTLEGQALDLGWARDARWDVSVDDYLYMASHKTAYYSAATPLAAGAICGHGTSEQVEGLRSFGMEAGLAFQLQDDLLNLVGDAAKQGKDFRSDITEGKRTLMIVWALERLGGSDRDDLLRILQAETTDVAQLAWVVDLLERVGAIDHAREYAHELVRSAKARLEGVDLEPGARKILLSMADFFVERLG